MQQRRREKFVPENGRVNQKENQSCLLLKERCRSRPLGLFQNFKRAGNFYQFQFTFGFLMVSCSAMLQTLSCLPFKMEHAQVT